MGNDLAMSPKREEQDQLGITSGAGMAEDGEASTRVVTVQEALASLLNTDVAVEPFHELASPNSSKLVVTPVPGIPDSNSGIGGIKRLLFIESEL